MMLCYNYGVILHTDLMTNQLTIIREIKEKGSYAKYECKCPCGLLFTPLKSNVNSGKTKSCGKCLKVPTGEVEPGTRLTFIGESPCTSKDRRGVFRCQCGVIKSCSITSVKNKQTLSCGCIVKENGEKRRGVPGKTKHGESKTPTWQSWVSMKARCNMSPDNPRYADYAGRGIKVCDRWVNSYENFLEDMGYRPEGHQIDRIDNDGDYTPENCRWVTRTVNGRNKRNNVLIERNGETRCLSEWCEILGLDYHTYKSRILRGTPPNEVFNGV